MIIIGRGLVANSFLDVDILDVVLFASGVSNSREERSSEFDREKRLLLKTICENKEKKFVYFSTCDFYDSKKNSKYLTHKFEMETLVKENCKSWLIFRVSQIIGKGNRNNLLFNFILNIKNKQTLNLYENFDRNLISIVDVKFIVLHYIKISDNEIINVANTKNIKVRDIVKIIESILSVRSISIKHDEENFFEIPLRKDYPTYRFQKDYYKIEITNFIQNIHLLSPT